MEQIIHYPSLKTLLMVEKTLRNSEVAISREELKRRMPTKVMHQTLNVVLDYLEKRGMILDGEKGLLWIYNPSPKLKKAILAGKKI